MYLYIISIISLLHYPIFLSLKTNCLNYDIIQNKCNLCAYGFYLKFDVILKEWKCILKNTEFANSNRKILISNEKETFLSYNFFDFIYTDIFECFSKETIFLENNFVLEEEIYLSKLLAKNV